MTLVREDKRHGERNGVYAYEVQKIKVLDDESPSTLNGTDTPKDNLQAYPVAKLLKDVEKSYDKGKKILEESRKADEAGRVGALAAHACEVAERLNPATQVIGEGEVEQTGMWRRAQAVLDDAEASAEAKSKAKKAQEQMQQAKGWYDQETGEVVVIPARHRDAEDVTATVLHENVAHKGSLSGRPQLSIAHLHNPVSVPKATVPSRKIYLRDKSKSQTPNSYNSAQAHRQSPRRHREHGGPRRIYLIDTHRLEDTEDALAHLSRARSCLRCWT